MGSPSQLSFLPDDYLERKAARRANAICAVLFLAVMGGIGSGFTLSEKATKRVNAEYAQVEEQYLAEAKRLDQVRQMQEKQKRMAHQAELSASLLERVPRSYLLAEFTNALPAGVSLMDFVMDSRVRVTAPAATEAGKTAYEMKKAQRQAAVTGKPAAAPGGAEPKAYDVSMKLTGVAHNDIQVAQYLSRLSRSPLLKDVNLIVTEEHNVGGDRLRKFQIEMMLSPTAQVQATVAVEAEQTTAVEVKE